MDYCLFIFTLLSESIRATGTILEILFKYLLVLILVFFEFTFAGRPRFPTVFNLFKASKFIPNGHVLNEAGREMT